MTLYEQIDRAITQIDRAITLYANQLAGRRARGLAFFTFVSVRTALTVMAHLRVSGDSPLSRYPQ